MASSFHILTHVLSQGGIIAHQTDTVFGLACLPQEANLQRLAHLKQRDIGRGFILLASSCQQLNDFIECTPDELKQLNHPQTHPTTYLVNAKPHLPASLIGQHTKIAVRISQHPTVSQICHEIGPIASTSCNISQQEICNDAHICRTLFGPQIDYIETDSIAGTGQASRIIDLSTQKVIRA